MSVQSLETREIHSGSREDKLRQRRMGTVVEISFLFGTSFEFKLVTVYINLLRPPCKRAFFFPKLPLNRLNDFNSLKLSEGMRH